jgi:hypothetical protein
MRPSPGFFYPADLERFIRESGMIDVSGLNLRSNDSDEGRPRKAGISPGPHSLTIRNSSIARNSLFGFLRLIRKARRAKFTAATRRVKRDEI